MVLASDAVATDRGRTFALARTARGYVVVLADMGEAEAKHLQEYWATALPDVPLAMVQGDQLLTFEPEEVPEGVRRWLEAALRK